MDPIQTWLADHKTALEAALLRAQTDYRCSTQAFADGDEKARAKAATARTEIDRIEGQLADVAAAEAVGEEKLKELKRRDAEEKRQAARDLAAKYLKEAEVRARGMSEHIARLGEDYHGYVEARAKAVDSVRSHLRGALFGFSEALGGDQDMGSRLRALAFLAGLDSMIPRMYSGWMVDAMKQYELWEIVHERNLGALRILDKAMGGEA